MSVDCGLAGAAWTVAELPPDWVASLVEDASGSPGAPAPSPLPPGPFSGWVSVEADSVVAAGAAVDIVMMLACGSDSARVIVSATACSCHDPTAATVETEALRLALHAAYPSPSSSPVTIRFDLPAGAPTRLSVHDVLGRRVRVLLGEFREAGLHAVRWEGCSTSGVRAAPGVYFVRLESGGGTLVQRVVRTR
jgi:hypothetical protein